LRKSIMRILVVVKVLFIHSHNIFTTLLQIYLQKLILNNCDLYLNNLVRWNMKPVVWSIVLILDGNVVVCKCFLNSYYLTINYFYRIWSYPRTGQNWTSFLWGWFSYSNSWESEHISICSFRFSWNPYSSTPAPK